MTAGGPAPSVARMLARGLARRCPRCGAGRLFTSWLRLRERCPRCAYRFEREEGFFLGAYVVNYAVVQALLLVLLFSYVAARSAGAEVPLAPFVAGGVAIAVVVPVVFYPFSRTLWAAIDLATRPLQPSEEADAATARAAEGF